MTEKNPQVLKRELGLFGAVMLGMGSIIGTGVFVSLGYAASLTGSWILAAILVAALVATFNGLSSAQLAANHPVSGGTYEYGYTYLNPPLGFTAGWMFLCAKSASAATAALGFQEYLLLLTSHRVSEVVAPGLVIVMTLLVLMGVRKSNRVNILIVLFVAAALLVFFASSIKALTAGEVALVFKAAEGMQMKDFFFASALMFVAYTGYGRIATMGEEVHHPHRTIPRAMILTLILVALLYGLTAVAVNLAYEGEVAYMGNAVLQEGALSMGGTWLGFVMILAAAVAMISVLINLLLGLSRVVLAMGRRRDLPGVFARIDRDGRSPRWAVLLVGGIVFGLTLSGDVKLTWSFSAFTVLVYYAITNLASLKLSAEDRLFPRWVSMAGLVSCLFLAVWVPWKIMLAGLVLLAAGLVWHRLRKKAREAVVRK